MNATNSSHDPEDHSNSPSPDETEPEAEAEKSGSMADTIVPLLMAVPGLVVARMTDDILPFVPGWGEYLLLAFGSFLVGNVLYFGAKAIHNIPTAEERAKAKENQK